MKLLGYGFFLLVILVDEQQRVAVADECIGTPSKLCSEHWPNSGRDCSAPLSGFGNDICFDTRDTCEILACGDAGCSCNISNQGCNPTYCDYRLSCTGSPKPCSLFTSSLECGSADGCTWQRSPTVPPPVPDPTLAPTTEIPCPCENGDNGGFCGICLQILPAEACPEDPKSLPGCSDHFTIIGGLYLCQTTNGECGTDYWLGNCPGGGFKYDVYRRIDCYGENSNLPSKSCEQICCENSACATDNVWSNYCKELCASISTNPSPTRAPITPTQAPVKPPPTIAPMFPSPAPAPAPPCACSNGDNGGACGICLRAVPTSECPPKPGLLPLCNPKLLVDTGSEFCEANNFECGTDNKLDNCIGEGTYDVYQQISCYNDDDDSGSSTASSCPSCHNLEGGNGGECGICLQLIDSSDCPDNPLLLPLCRRPSDLSIPGELCEAFNGDCGTSITAANCAITLSDGSVDTYHAVYRYLPCNCICANGDNNGECGICLKAIEEDEVESSSFTFPGCRPDSMMANMMAYGDVCLSSNWGAPVGCGTSNGGSGFYRFISCDDPSVEDESEEDSAKTTAHPSEGVPASSPPPVNNNSRAEKGNSGILYIWLCPQLFLLLLNIL